MELVFLHNLLAFLIYWHALPSRRITLGSGEKDWLLDQTQVSNQSFLLSLQTKEQKIRTMQEEQTVQQQQQQRYHRMVHQEGTTSKHRNVPHDHQKNTALLDREKIHGTVHVQKIGDEILAMCPSSCSCTGPSSTSLEITHVNCTSAGLGRVPKLPPTTLTLSLMNNSIQHLNCNDLENTRELQILDLSSNLLTEVKDCFFAPTSALHSLNLSQNRIKYLKRGLFKYLPQLESLILVSSSVQYLEPFAFDGMPNLITLDLSLNRLSRLANYTFQGLFSLKSLNLQGNRLLYSPDTFEQLAFDGLNSLDTLILWENNPTQEHEITQRMNKAKISSLTDVYIRRSDSSKLHHQSICNVTELAKTGKIKSLFNSSSRRSLSPGHFNFTANYSSVFKRNSLGNIHHGPEHKRENRKENMKWDYPDTALSFLHNLTSLYIDGLPGAVPGPGFLQLRELSTVRFDSLVCNIGAFEPIFFHHFNTSKKLYLNFNGCRIVSIPPQLFGPIPNIYSLDLSVNQNLGLKGFAKGVTGLAKSNITELNLSSLIGNVETVVELTKDILMPLRYTPLKKLELSKNRIYKVDFFAIIFLPKTIEYLSLRDNNIQFASFLVALPMLKNLKVLVASHQVVYKGSDNGTPLAETNNSIHRERITEEFCPNSPSLGNDILDENYIKQSNNETHSYSTSLQHTKSSSVKNLPPIPFPPALEELYISDMNLRYSIPAIVFANTNSLRRLEFAYNRATCWEGPLKNAPHLEYLDLSRNYCRKASLRFFQFIPSLITLIVRTNALGLVFVDDHEGTFFSSLTNLEVLDLTDNIIKTLHPDTFLRNVNLRSLNLSQNFLVEFSPHLNLMTRLEHLDLSDNRLRGFSEGTTQELVEMVGRNQTFRIDLQQNDLLCGCEYLSFLDFICQQPDVFVNVTELSFRNAGSFPRMCALLPRLRLNCISQETFTAVLLCFSVFCCCLSICAVLYHYRWRLKFLLFIGKQRMHIRTWPRQPTVEADVYLTYEQDDHEFRQLVQRHVLPALKNAGFSCVVGETDFPAGNELNHISNAIFVCRKMLVLLSSGIFEESKREFELNMAIMYELHLRRPYVIPVFVEDDVYACLSRYSPEIVTFLDTQHDRWLHYSDTEVFWTKLNGQMRQEV